MTIMESIIVGLIVAELYTVLPALAEWLARRQASKLPSDLAARMRDEWLAEIAAIHGNFRKVRYAAGLFRGIDDIVRTHQANTTKSLTAEPGEIAITGGSGVAELKLGGLLPSTAQLFAPSIAVSVGTAAGRAVAQAATAKPATATFSCGIADTE